eukprot:1713105-Pyramimonas_sp.AAC.1
MPVLRSWSCAAFPLLTSAFVITSTGIKGRGIHRMVPPRRDKLSRHTDRSIATRRSFLEPPVSRSRVSKIPLASTMA